MHALSGFMRVFETPVDVYGRISVLAHDDAGVGAADEVAAVSIGTAPSVGSIHLLKHDNFTPS
jgi:hypothetical protein